MFFIIIVNTRGLTKSQIIRSVFKIYKSHKTVTFLRWDFGLYDLYLLVLVHSLIWNISDIVWLNIWLLGGEEEELSVKTPEDAFLHILALGPPVRFNDREIENTPGGIISLIICPTQNGTKLNFLKSFSS